MRGFSRYPTAEALRLIAEAGLAVVYCDRLGVVRMEAFLVRSAKRSPMTSRVAGLLPDAYSGPPVSGHQRGNRDDSAFEAG